MRVNGKPFKSLWFLEDKNIVQIIDQTQLPFHFVVRDLASVREFADAIQGMQVRGAILIGVTAAFGMYFAALQAQGGAEGENALKEFARQLKATRPTAVNLAWAVDLQLKRILSTPKDDWAQTALESAKALYQSEEEACRRIGEHGLELIRTLPRGRDGRIQILTHCNAGWLACTDYGTATSPIYAAHDAGIPVHVWVDETRPWNQGARLTAWELGQHGVPHTVIADNTGGHLLQHGMVNLVIVGSDRVTRTGDVANKIGTYLKALAAADNRVPFYAAFPSSTFDWTLRDGVREIPIEERNPDEVQYLAGWDGNRTVRVQVTAPGSPALNLGFDVTPARLVTGLITERGLCAAKEDAILHLFPERHA